MIEQRKYDYFKVYITTKIASVVLFYTERKKKTQNTLGVKLWKININLPFFVVFFCHVSNNIFTPSCTRLPCFKYPMIWTDCLTYRVPSFDHWVALRCTLCFLLLHQIWYHKYMYFGDLLLQTAIIIFSIIAFYLGKTLVNKQDLSLNLWNIYTLIYIYTVDILNLFVLIR